MRRWDKHSGGLVYISRPRKGAIDIEENFRIAAFKWLEKLTEIYGEVLPYQQLREGFYHEGERITVMGPAGIWKPKQFKLIPISITTSPNSPYDDYSNEKGFIIYRYRGTNPQHRDNVGLREAWKRQTPLIYFHGNSIGKYFAYWPVFIVGDDPASLSFTVAFDDASLAGFYSDQVSGLSHRFDDLILREDAAYRRQYATSAVKTRLHQSAFRTRVLEAYHEQCTFCRLRHPELLDAAHILPDSHPEGIPEVPNGLSLCKIHHAAFDRNIIGITPDYEIRVQERVLNERDGPMLRHGIQELHQRKLILPHSEKHWPDRRKLEERFRAFSNA